MGLDNKDLLSLAALLHDIGKFGQRAEIEHNSSFDKKTYNHMHAAYTAQILQDYFAFDESYRDYSAMHHNVRETSGDAEYWIIASADRLASGFEREAFDEINGYKDWESENFKEQRLRVLFNENHKEYSIKALSPETIFNSPEKTNENEYKVLWQAFKEELKEIMVDGENKTIKIGNSSTDLVTIDYLLKKYTSFMPSSTTFQKGNYEPVKANIPLYDHLKTTAVFVSAINAMEEKQKDNVLNYYKKQNPYAPNQQDFLLIAGDFFGIQDFIFDNIQASKASKILRAKSAYIQILTKVLVLSLCEELQLSRLAIISDSAGKFELLAPNNNDIIIKLKSFQKKLNQHFKEKFFAQSGVGISYQPCSMSDFLIKKEKQEKSPYQILRDKLANKVEQSKFEKFDLAQEEGYILPLDEDLDNQHLCPLCQKRKKPKADNDESYCELCEKFVTIGKRLVDHHFLVIGKAIKSEEKKIDIFDNWDIIFVKDKENIKAYKDTIAIYDITNKQDFNGYAKWELASYVRQYKEETEKYNKKMKKAGEKAKVDKHMPMLFNHLADQSCQGNTEEGVKALIAVKADVDDMGKFIKCSKKRLQSDTPINNSFAKFNFFSRLIDYFFSVYVPYLMQDNYKNTYTIFAGGDDLFIIGAWDEVIALTAEIRERFKSFCDEKLTISTGLIMFKPHTPINYIAQKSEEALEQAKCYTDQDENTKNAITLFDQTVDFKTYDKIKEKFKSIEKIAENKDYTAYFGTAFWYRLIELSQMATNLKEACEGKIEFNPEDAMWKSKLHYSLQRNVIDKVKVEDKQQFIEFKNNLEKLIDSDGSKLNMVLFEYLYKRRKQ